MDLDFVPMNGILQVHCAIKVFEKIHADREGVCSGSSLYHNKKSMEQKVTRFMSVHSTLFQIKLGGIMQ